MEQLDLLQQAPGLAANILLVVLFLKFMASESKLNRSANAAIAESDQSHHEQLQDRMEAFALSQAETLRANTEALLDVVKETGRLRQLIDHLDR